MLVQRRNPAVRAYFFWGYYLGTDSEERAREATQKLQAPNAAHFWMPGPELSTALASSLKLGAGRTPFDVYLLYRRGVLWESAIPAPTYWQQQNGLVQADAFDIARLESRIQQLLGG
jgi:hypothetical protein